MLDLHAPLVNPIAKLDIRDLLKSSPSPPPSQTTQAPPFSRSILVPSSYAQHPAIPSPSTSGSSQYSTSTVPAIPFNHQQSQPHRQHPAQPIYLSNTSQAVFQQNPKLNPAAAASASGKRPPPDDHPVGSPKRKQTKWSPAENALIIQLRGSGLKWEDISKKLPGRSAISCRLHYQNYLEKRSEWDEEKRNKLARVYERLKPELWQPIANDLGVPWRAAEAMHWALGEHEMARRANVTPFSIAAAHAEPGEPGGGRVAQRDRMLESTRVFEGQDLRTLNSPFNGNRSGHHPTPYGATPSLPTPGIGSGEAFPGYDDDEEDVDVKDEDDEDEEEKPKVRRRRRGGETRLPGLAELEGGISAFAGRGRRVKGEEQDVKRRRE
ncbi:hypothetical protein MMC28_008166 [Mycoblastus sanguinarius]|nr:hypothetical protein [Mycoblastus sanguinarius]